MDNKDAANRCSECKHETNISGRAHQQHCMRFPKDGEPQPCVAVRPFECKGGESWEPRG